MQNPIVSVIVTTYNREEFLKETIQSILNQTYKDFELIVVDNFSNYDFFKVIEEFGDSRIRPFQNANNGIIAVNRNYGISKAKGKYLAFCDDDDLWMPDKLKLQMDILTKYEDRCIVCTNIARFRCDVKNVILKKGRDNNVSLNSLLRKNPIATSSVLLNNSQLVKFCESIDLITVEDYELWIRLNLQGFRICYLGTPLVYYREGVQNTSKGENKILLPIRRIRLLSSIRINLKLSNYRYVLHVLVNLVELIARLFIK